MSVNPSFRQPPVVETALSIQFDELRTFRTTHFGLYHTTILDRFPLAEDKPRLQPVIEPFPLGPRLPTLRIGPDEGRPARVWYRDALDGCEMLQLQPDRLAFNWCKREGVEYPRYAANRPRLLEELEKFRQFAAQQRLGNVVPNLCEVTYVNHIIPLEGESATECFATVFKGISWQSSDAWLPQPPEVAALNRTFPIGVDQGRLYVEASISSDKTLGHFVLLKITARVIHGSQTGLTEDLDLAHEWVVKSFVSVTEESARRDRWKQES